MGISRKPASRVESNKKNKESGPGYKKETRQRLIALSFFVGGTVGEIQSTAFNEFGVEVALSEAEIGKVFHFSNRNYLVLSKKELEEHRATTAYGKKSNYYVFDWSE